MKFLKPSLFLVTSIIGTQLCAENESSLIQNDQETVELEPYLVRSILGGFLSSTHTISRGALDSKSGVSIGDAFDSISSIHTDSPDFLGPVSLVYIRGGDPNFVSVYWDGIELNDATNSRGGAFDLSTLDLAGVERIEVVNTPLSSWRGSGGLSGGINIISEEPGDQFSKTLSGGVGKSGAIQGSIKISAPFKNGSAMAAVSHRDIHVVDSGAGIRNNSFLGKLNWKVNDRYEFSILSRQLKQEGERLPDFSGGQRFALSPALEENTTDEMLIAWQNTLRTSETSELFVNLSYLERKEEINNPGVAPSPGNPFSAIPANFSDSNFDDYTLRGQWETSTFDSLDLSLGGMAKHEEGIVNNSNAVFGNLDLERESFGVFTNAVYNPIDSLEIQGRLQWNSLEDFDDNFSPHFSAKYVYEPLETTASFQYSRAFKQPSFFALGSAFGNPNLEVEESEIFEWSLKKDFMERSLSIEATYFMSEYNKIITFDPSVFQLVNNDNLSSKGVELSFNYKKSNWALNGFISVSELELSGLNPTILDRPEKQAGLGTTIALLPELNVSLNYVYTGEINAFTNPTGNTVIGSASRVDLDIQYQPIESMTVGLNIRNLFDQSHDVAVGELDLGFYPSLNVRLDF